MRDPEKDPYDASERRVVDYILEATKGTIGGGDDPIGFLIACHAAFADPTPDMLSAGARAIGASMSMLNHIDRADHVWRAMVRCSYDGVLPTAPVTEKT